MKKYLLVTIVLFFITLTSCTKEQDDNDIKEEPGITVELTDFEKIMVEKDLNNYTISDEEFIEIYKTLSSYQYLENYYQDTKIKKITIEFLDALLSTELSELTFTDVYNYKTAVNEYYSRSNSIDILLSSEKMNLDNEQLYMYSDMKIIIYKVCDSLFKIEYINKNNMELTIDTSLGKVYQNDKDISNFEAEFISILNGSLSIPKVQLYVQDDTINYIYDFGNQTLINRYYLEDCYNIIFNAHHINEDYIFGVTDFTKSVSLLIKEFNGSPIEIFEFVENESNVIEVLNGYSDYQTFISDVRHHFIDFDTIVFD